MPVPRNALYETAGNGSAWVVISNCDSLTVNWSSGWEAPFWDDGESYTSGDTTYIMGTIQVEQPEPYRNPVITSYQWVLLAMLILLAVTEMFDLYKRDKRTTID